MEVTKEDLIPKVISLFNKLFAGEYHFSANNLVRVSCETTWEMRSSSNETTCFELRLISIRDSLGFYGHTILLR